MPIKRKKTTAPLPRPKMLPCPCCGGKPTYLEEYGAKSIKCKECGLQTASVAFGSFIQSGYDAEIQVVGLWNRRTNHENA